MRVYRPTDNQLTGGYTSIHPAYDFAGLKVPDEVRAGANGVIVERVDAYSTNWRTTGALTTKDYGNYIKIKHDDGSIELHAHLRQGSAFVLGTRVTAGQIVARIGNTGNSTGPHVHSEYRNAQNVNISVEFYTKDDSADDYHRGYNVTNKKSTRIIIDEWFKEKENVKVLQDRIIELEKRPESCPQVKSYKEQKDKIIELANQIA